MHVETTPVSTSVPATRTLHTATVSADSIRDLAFKEAARQLCDAIGAQVPVKGTFNADGSITVSAVVVTLDGVNGLAMRDGNHDEQATLNILLHTK